MGVPQIQGYLWPIRRTKVLEGPCGAPPYKKLLFINYPGNPNCVISGQVSLLSLAALPSSDCKSVWLRVRAQFVCGCITTSATLQLLLSLVVLLLLITTIVTIIAIIVANITIVTITTISTGWSQSLRDA